MIYNKIKVIVAMKYEGYNGYTNSPETSPESQAVAQLYLNHTQLAILWKSKF